MVREFENKLVLIPGGAGQLGQAVCTSFLQAGATVVLPYLSEGEMQTFRAGPGAGSDAVRYVHLDALDAKRAKEAVAYVVEHWGRPDVLVHLAGGYAFGPAAAEAEVEDFQKMLDINFLTLVNLCRATLPHMIAAGSGRIVTVGSRAGLEGAANHAAYSAAKAAVIRYTESVSAEVKQQGIGVNCVLPSIIDTPANRQTMPDADPKQSVAPADLAEVILFLASPRSRSLHGAALPVYGLV